MHYRVECWGGGHNYGDILHYDTGNWCGQMVIESTIVQCLEMWGGRSENNIDFRKHSSGVI